MQVLSKFPFLRRMPVTWIRVYSKDLILIALPLKDLISEYVYIILEVRASPYEMGRWGEEERGWGVGGEEMSQFSP